MVVDAPAIVVRGQALEYLSLPVCEDPMHCCSPIPDPKFLLKTAYLLCARVTYESRDNEIQYMKYCTCVYPLLTLN